MAIFLIYPLSVSRSAPYVHKRHRLYKQRGIIEGNQLNQKLLRESKLPNTTNKLAWLGNFRPKVAEDETKSNKSDQHEI